MSLGRIAALGASMAMKEIKLSPGLDEDGTLLFPPEPLDEHWSRLEAIIGRPLSHDEERAFMNAFNDVAWNAARTLALAE